MKTRQLTVMALYLALIIISGLFAIPTPMGIPIVLQNMVCALGGALLGKKHGTMVVLVFILCILIGLPVLPGGRSGAAVFAGATGSFFIGYVLSPFLIGLALEKVKSRTYVTYFIIFWLFGALFINLTGIPSLSYHSGGTTAALKTILAFMPGDTIKAFAVAWVAQRLLATGKFKSLAES
ncbi:MAG: biotin transporter BioY [Peptoniphilus sp.]|nr:biotin transporter BioY [Peptoniphilus sp.]MDD7363615.1 biotin transporter BioY [Bacillota bacterium]MDY6045194.1 biotin transporter BioY [Peptoniphilus sp.]